MGFGVHELGVEDEFWFRVLGSGVRSVGGGFRGWWVHLSGDLVLLPQILHHPFHRFRVHLIHALGLRTEGSGFGVQGLGLRVHFLFLGGGGGGGCEFRLRGLTLWVQAVESRV